MFLNQNYVQYHFWRSFWLHWFLPVNGLTEISLDTIFEFPLSWRLAFLKIPKENFFSRNLYLNVLVCFTRNFLLNRHIFTPLFLGILFIYILNFTKIFWNIAIKFNMMIVKKLFKWYCTLLMEHRTPQCNGQLTESMNTSGSLSPVWVLMQDLHCFMNSDSSFLTLN